MRYLSVCSGIEAVTVAWKPLGWQCVGLAETDPFCSAVLRHHYPDIHNYGDLFAWRDWDTEPFDILVGGTPCQSFSITGQKKGFDDDRGQLTMEFFDLLNEYRPEWFVWENVPGLLSNDGGDSFAAILCKLGQCGFYVGWRVLDTQYVRVDGFERAIPQRRRRVFLVGHRDKPECAAKVLFESESVRRNTPPRRRKKHINPNPAGSLLACGAGVSRVGGIAAEKDFVVLDYNEDVSKTLTTEPSRWDATRDTLIVNQDVSKTLMAKANVLDPTIETFVLDNDVSATLCAQSNGGGWPGSNANELGFYVAQGLRARRLTPVECARLQGFDDDYLNIPWRGKDRPSDTKQYKAYGNAMSVNVIRWIGRRIQAAC